MPAFPKGALAVCAAAALSACDATVPLRIDTPVSRFDTPEVPQGSFNGQVAYHDATSVELTPDIENQDPDTENPTLNGTNSGSNKQTGLANLGVTAAGRHRLSVFRNDLTGDAPYGLKYQFQFLGPLADDAGAGDVSASITLAGGVSNVAEGDAGRDAEYDQIMQDIGLLAGVRLADSLSLYAGPWFTKHRYYGEFSRPAENNDGGSGGDGGDNGGGLIPLPGGGGDGDDGDDMGGGTGGTGGPVVSDLRGEIYMRGASIGLAWSPDSAARLTLIGEINRVNIESGNLRRYETAGGISLRFGIGAGIGGGG